MPPCGMRSWLWICRHGTWPPALRDGYSYLFSSLFKILMLPEAHDVPSCLSESFIGVPVASLVSVDLCSPVGAVLLWPGPMDRATMPEAAVDEDRYAFPRENDVDLSANTGENASLHAVPEPPSVQRRSKMHFRLCSLLPSSTHSRPCGRGRCLRRVWIRHGSFTPSSSILRLATCFPRLPLHLRRRVAIEPSGVVGRYLEETRGSFVAGSLNRVIDDPPCAQGRTDKLNRLVVVKRLSWKCRGL